MSPIIPKALETYNRLLSSQQGFQVSKFKIYLLPSKNHSRAEEVRHLHRIFLCFHRKVRQDDNQQICRLAWQVNRHNRASSTWDHLLCSRLWEVAKLQPRWCKGYHNHLSGPKDPPNQWARCNSSSQYHGLEADKDPTNSLILVKHLEQIANLFDNRNKPSINDNQVKSQG